MDDYKTIGEVSEQLNIPTHVLRFWETQFKQIKPVKRRGGRRFYNESDVELIENIRIMLHVKGLTIKGAQKELVSKNQKFLVQLTPHVSNDGGKDSLDVRRVKKVLANLKIAHQKLLQDS